MSLKILSDYLLLVFIYKISEMTTSEVGTRNFINPYELFTGLFQLFPILKGNKKEILRTPFQFISWQMYFNAGWLLGGRGSAISISIKYESSHGWRGSVTNSPVAADSWIIQKEFKAWQFHPRPGKDTGLVQQTINRQSWTITEKAPSIEPSPGWKQLLPLSHLRHY